MDNFPKQQEQFPTQNESKDIFDIQKIKEKYGKLNTGFEEFEGYLDNIENENIKQDILDIFSTSNKLESKYLKKYIRNNGFPNTKTIDIFNEKFGIKNIEEDTEEKKEDTEEKKEDTEEKKEDIKKLYLSRYEEIKDIESSNEYFNEVKDLLGSLEKGDIESSKITEYLKGLNSEQFNSILVVFEEYDDVNGTNLYSSFKDTLISIDSGFENRIKAFEDIKSDKVFNVEGAVNKAIFGLDNIKYGDSVSSKVDYSKRPPERFLSNGDYSLETPLGIRDFYKATVKFEKGKQGLDKERKEVGALGEKKFNELTEKEDTLKDLENAEIRDEEYINKLKTEIEQIKVELTALQEQFNSFEEKYAELEEQYQIDLANEVENYRNTIKEQDKGSLDTLDLLHSIGFDMLPQSDTDKLIAQVNDGISINRGDIDLGEGFRLNSDINLSKGRLGYSDSVSGTSSREKQIFIRFFNKILSGNPTDPINPTEAVMNPNYQVSDILLENYRMKLYDGGTFNMNEAISNLENNVNSLK